MFHVEHWKQNPGSTEAGQVLCALYGGHRCCSCPCERVRGQHTWPLRTSNLRLEEIESSTWNDKPVWLITLSNSGDYGALTGFASLTTALGTDNTREYKVFTVAKDTGEALAMKIRLLAVPSA